AGARDVVADRSDGGEVVARVRSALEMLAMGHMLSDASVVLEERVRERTRELQEARSEVLERLVVAAEFRDDDTRDHTRRVGETGALLAAAAGLDAGEVETIRLAAPLHDIGKIGVADAVLLKRGALTDDEFSAIRIHPVIGARILWGTRAPVLKTAGEIALCHHERWDGRGYPAGFAGEDIPLSARITAVADVFDALTHDRPYRTAWPVERALEELRTGAATQLDPRLAALFDEIIRAGALETITWS
ncbi:MAG: HD-GYP domain-containing protein, partial [Actinomycetota bacterium]